MSREARTVNLSQDGPLPATDPPRESQSKPASCSLSMDPNTALGVRSAGASGLGRHRSARHASDSPQGPGDSTWMWSSRKTQNRPSPVKTAPACCWLLPAVAFRCGAQVGGPRVVSLGSPSAPTLS